MRAPRCQVNLLKPSMLHTNYVPCGQPATWYTEDVHVAPAGLHMCEEHMRQIAMAVDDDAEFSEVA